MLMTNEVPLNNKPQNTLVRLRLATVSKQSKCYCYKITQIITRVTNHLQSLHSIKTIMFDFRNDIIIVMSYPDVR
jgi:hypothetical protein